MPNKKKIKALLVDDFFEAIAKNSNFIPVDTVRDVYYGMVRVIGQELRAKGAVDLPDLGTLVIHKHKERMSVDVNTGQLIKIPEKSTIKFRPCFDLKKYFHLLD
jgi:nucleoid DNA-binding protein